MTTKMTGVEVNDLTFITKRYGNNLLPLYKEVKKDMVNLGYSYVGGGSYREVFKKPFARQVVKLGDPNSNKVEFVLSKVVKDTPLENLFALATDISECGTVLVQEYIRKGRTIPGGLYLCGPDKWMEFQRTLEDEIRLGNSLTISDLNYSNIVIDRKNTGKIVDFGFCDSILGTRVSADLSKVLTKDNLASVIEKLRKVAQKKCKNLSIRLECLGGMLKLITNNEVKAEVELK